MGHNKKELFMEMIHEEIGEDHKLTPIIAALVEMVGNEQAFEELYYIHEGIEEYGQFLTEKEAKHIVDAFENYDGTRGAKWQPQTLFQAVESLGGEKAVKGKYNCWALYALMNWIHSDYGGALQTKLQGNDYAMAVYLMAQAWINDRDGEHDVRELFL